MSIYNTLKDTITLIVGITIIIFTFSFLPHIMGKVMDQEDQKSYCNRFLKNHNENKSFEYGLIKKRLHPKVVICKEIQSKSWYNAIIK